MPGLAPPRIILSAQERAALEKLVRKHGTPQQTAMRARIVLLAADGLNNRQIKRQLGVSRDMVRQWRARWLELSDGGVAVEQRLEDAPRPGVEATFTAEQQCHLFALACSDPRESGREISHWSSAELAEEMVKRGYVVSISRRHVSRLLQEADLKPHRVMYWLMAPEDETRDDGVREICQVYEQAQERDKRGNAQRV